MGERWRGGVYSLLYFAYFGGRMACGAYYAASETVALVRRAHDGVLSARWKSVRGFYLDPEIEANCVVARRGGEQAKMNYRTAG